MLMKDSLSGVVAIEAERIEFENQQNYIFYTSSGMRYWDDKDAVAVLYRAGKMLAVPLVDYYIEANAVNAYPNWSSVEYSRNIGHQYGEYKITLDDGKCVWFTNAFDILLDYGVLVTAFVEDDSIIINPINHR